MSDTRNNCISVPSAAEKAAQSDTVRWMKENRLTTVGGIWLVGVAGSLGYNYTRPITTQLKIMHSRVYAQAITLGALGASAVCELYLSDHDHHYHNVR